MTHGFFLVMGGFTLHDERGTALRILEPMELESLSEAGRIEWPSITEEEIQDRSKGDYLSKGIVLVQTSWFIAQCIVRGVYKLEVTELEVATLAFAALNGVTYYLWWHKPLDVRCSIPVYLLKDDKKEGMHSQSITSVSLAGNSVPFSPPISCGPSENLKANHIDPQSPIIEESQIPQQPLVVIRDPEPTLQEPSHHNATTAQESKFTRLSAFIQRKRQKHGIVLGLAYVFLLYPFFAFFGAFSDMIISDTLHDSVPLRVPTFYSSKFSDDDNPIRSSLPVTISVAVIFGGIHCVAWSFHFPTLQEQLAWRISAASVAGLPILIIVFAMFCGYFEERIQDWTILGKIFAAVELPMAIALIVLYVIARIVLLVLPCIGLRALHHTAFVEIQWAAFFPHIG
jgi:hypothetical protein